MNTPNSPDESDLKNVALQAVKDFGAEQQEKQAEKEKSDSRRNVKQKIKLAAQVLSVMACAIIIAIQISQLNSLKEEGEKPARKGNYVTDTETDQCIHNLWLMSNRLQLGQLADDGPVCPLSGDKYIVTREEAVISARCPNPSRHGFISLQVSNKNPVPELIK